MNKEYDILFVYGFSRFHPYLLNIVKYLGKDYKIAIGMLNLEKHYSLDGAKRIKKLNETEKEFIEYAKKLGSDIFNIEDVKEVTAKLLLLPQAPFNSIAIDLIKKSIKAECKVVLQGFGYGKNLLDECLKLGFSKIFVYEKNIFENIIKNQDREDLLFKYKIVEMGSPYFKYPVFNDEIKDDIDYIVAFPTLIFLRDSHRKNNLIKNIWKLVSNIEKSNNIAVKLHNVKDKGNMYLDRLNISSITLASYLEKYFGKKGRQFSMAIYYKNIENRTVQMSNYTKYYNFGLELFLPHVKKGVITGISTVIWHCLYNKIPVYNCDSQEFNKNMPNYPIYKNFYIPCNNANLKFNEEYYDKISDSSRNADLIELIKEEIK